MNISLTSELEAWVQAKVESGMYTSASEVVREALRLQAQFDLSRSAQINALNSAIDIGLSDINAGHVFDETESRKHLASRRQPKRNA